MLKRENMLKKVYIMLIVVQKYEYLLISKRVLGEKTAKMNSFITLCRIMIDKFFN